LLALNIGRIFISGHINVEMPHRISPCLTSNLSSGVEMVDEYAKSNRNGIKTSKYPSV
jgi:hypothetical protein